MTSEGYCTKIHYIALLGLNTKCFLLEEVMNVTLRQSVLKEILLMVTKTLESKPFVITAVFMSVVMSLVSRQSPFFVRDLTAFQQ